MTKLYLLWYDNGLAHDDHCETLLGIYDAPHKRDLAQVKMAQWNQWPFGEEGFFNHVDTFIGDEFIKEHGK